MSTDTLANLRPVFSLHAVRGEDGNIDVDATTAKLGGLVALYAKEQLADREEIATRVHAIFSENPGASLTMDFVANKVAFEMNAASGPQMGMIIGRVKDYIRDNADRNASKEKTLEDGTLVPAVEGEAFGTRTFHIQKGRGKGGLGGGVLRCADVAKKPE